MRGPDVAAVDLGGALHVTPAGSIAVATDALLASGDRLRALDAELVLDMRRVRAADAIAAGWPVDDILAPLERVRELCSRGCTMLDRIIANYNATESLVERVQRDIAAVVAAAIGSIAPGALTRLLLLQPHVVAAAALLGWAAIPDHGDGKLATVREFFMRNPELITSPGFVRFVSLLSTSLDDGILGSMGMPPLLAGVPGFELGDDGGVASGALAVASLGTLLGMFRETPVRVERVTSADLEAPAAGVRGRLDRIPEVNQVRIEKYEAEGMPPRYAVFVGPTETFSPFATDEPWDSTSNVHGVARRDPGSLRAVELAMADAGVRPGDEVLVTGFSQGGLIATMVAASGDWNVVALETHGAPAGNIPVPDGIAGLAIRNSDDLVPALGGPQRDHTLVQVERRAFRAGVEIPDIQAAPAHQRTAYERTATAIDAAASQVVRQQIAALDAFSGDYLGRDGGHATVTTYRATRLTAAG